MNNQKNDSMTQPEDLEQSRIRTKHLFSKADRLPISFNYDGKKFSGIPNHFRPVHRIRRMDSNLIETIFEGEDPETHLNIRLECLEYQDFPVVEWVVWFTNKGRQMTPILKDLLAIDCNFSGTSPILNYCNGDFWKADGYTPFDTLVGAGETLNFAPKGGRPCDSAFPYFRIQFEGYGLSVAVGWPAQWAAGFAGTPDGIHISAGQEKTNLRLMPGESIRTPRMTVMSWVGQTSRSINLWRRWYSQHIIPKPDGKPIKTLLACAATDEGEEFTQATEENQIAYMNKFKERGFDFDVWWIDAGWYSCKNEENQNKWTLTGTWEPDLDRFPRGFTKVSETAQSHGASLLLWFEPERVYVGSKLDREHPEWLLKVEQCDDPNEKQWILNNRLLNLGIPECRKWLTDHICEFIQSNGIKIYRQDFNFPPLQYWRDNEVEDRQGINENLYVQGYLQFWDDLLLRNPGLWIDSCSSGGRRNDLETMRRSVPLHYTDFGYGHHSIKLAFHQTLYEWIPYFKEFTLSWDTTEEGDYRTGKYVRFDKLIDSFSYHCGMAPMMFASLDIRRDDYDFELGVKMINIWRQVSELMLHGDFYPLTPHSKSDDKWHARQFDMPEGDQGFIQGIRFAACPDDRFVVYPSAVRNGCTYLFNNPENMATLKIEGSFLIENGFEFKLPARSGAIWFYRVIDEKSV
jgi:alpha-galactosidase